MNSDPHPKPDEIFAAALDLPPDQRQKYIRAACAEDKAVETELLSLLAAYEASEDFMDTPIAPPVTEAVRDDAVGRLVGAYRLIESIGAGGMGHVYLAERVEGEFEQRVAVKLIHRGILGDESVRRFRNECRALAMLEHPNVARMIDGGFAEDGTPYIVMEYVDGRPIDVYCDELTLAVEDRLRLFRDVCAAVHQAHKHSTIHRDIKPGNILVTDDGQVKLIDFGIARIMDAPEEISGRTATGFEMMTPAYASPEQLRGELLSTSTDIYSLGVVLYRLLTGQLPFAEKGRRALEQLIMDSEATRPSDAVIRDHDPTTSQESKRKARRLRGDLDTIVLMALRKEHERRYASAEQFSDDIGRFLSGQPVIAQPDTVGYRTTKFIRRNRVAVSAAALMVLVLTASAVISFQMYRSAERERLVADAARAAAEQKEKTANAVTKFMTGIFDEAAPARARGASLSARDIVDRGRMRIEEELDSEPAVKSRVLRAIGEVYQSLGEPDSARSLLAEAVAIERIRQPGAHRGLASALRAYADFLDETSRYDSAQVINEEALAMMEEIYGPDDYRLAPFMNRVALISQVMSLKVKTAWFRRSLAIMEKEYDRDDPMIAFYLINLGGALRADGKYEEAYQHIKRSLDIREAALDEDDPYLGQSLGSLAATLSKMGRFQESLQLRFRDLALSEKIYGADNPHTTPALSGLADAYMGLDRYEEARPLYERCLRINIATYGPVHLWVGNDHTGLGDVCLQGGQLEEANTHYTIALSVFRKVYSERHQLTSHPLIGLGKVESARGRCGKALSHFELALSVAEDGWGPEHPNLADILEPYATCLTALGQDSLSQAMTSRATKLRATTP